MAGRNRWVLGVRCWALTAIFLSLFAAQGVRAEELAWVTGKINGADGRPLRNALIAVYDDKNKVVDYARTDDNGEYALAVPSKVLHLNKKGKGFFTEVFNGVTRFVGDAAGFVATPLRSGVRAVTSAQANLNPDPISRGGIAAGGAIVDQVLFAVTPRRRATVQEERKQPGAMVIKAVSPGTKDLVAIGRVYWVQKETFRAGGKETKNLAAWLDPIQLQRTESEKPSTIGTETLTFTGARLEPSIAEPGDRVRIMARLPLPLQPTVYITVVARNNRTGQKWELLPERNGVYAIDIEVDKRFPKDDQTISILAYAAQENKPGRRGDVERAIEKSGLWDPNKIFVPNPLLAVSRNRADLTLTVVAPSKR
jgi:hypothetical protein